MPSELDIAPREPKSRRPRSEAQAAASRANGAASHGPKSAAGKARSRLNALKHGLCGEFILLPGESQQAYSDLRQAYYIRFQPADRIEASAVDLLVKLDWQIGRASVDERNVVFLRMDDQRERFNREFSDPHPSLRVTRARQVEMQPGEAGDIFDRHLGRLDRAYNRALHRLHFIKTKFPLAPDLPENESEPASQPQTLNSRNEPEPPTTAVESTPHPARESAALPAPNPLPPAAAFSSYALDPVLVPEPPAAAPKPLQEVPQTRFAAA